MTIPTLTTTPASPAASSGSTPAGSAPASIAGASGFAGLMQMILGRQGSAAVAPVTAGAAGTGDPTGAAAGEASADAAVASESIPAEVAMPATGGPQGAPQTAATAGADSGEQTRQVADEQQGHTGEPVPAVAVAAGAPITLPLHLRGATGAPTAGDVSRGGQRVAASTIPEPGTGATVVADPAKPGTFGVAALPGAESATPTAPAVVASGETAVAPVANNANADTSGASGQLAGSTNSTAPTAAAGLSATGGTAEPAGPVGGQVFPEVARLVTRGDGTQRLTLRLSPESLGDVRIVVNVRDGAVDVTLSAGRDAQEALRNGSPELRRLLEAVGAGGAQIVVRDLPSQSASAPSTPGQAFGASGWSSDSTGTGGSGRGHPGDNQAAGRGTSDARHPSTAAGPLPDDPTTKAPAPGVDLRL